MFRKLIYACLTLILIFSMVGPVFAAQEDLDPAFGNGGKVLTDFQGTNRGSAAILQPDGKILVAGSAFTGMDDDFALARYNPDGSLDPDFGTGGKVTTDISNSYLMNINTATAEQLESLPGIGPFLAQRIVDYRNEHGPFLDVTGIQLVPGIGPLTFHRIEDLITVGTDTAYGLALQPDGKIVVVGESTHNLAMVRYHPDGSLDSSFDGDGRAFMNLGGNDYLFNVAVQDDGGLVASGRSGWNLILARFTSDGSLDPAFDNDGTLIFDFGSGENLGGFLALQPDGRIILAGQTFVLGEGYLYALARFHPDGSLDSSYGTGGIVTMNLENSFDDFIAALVLQPDGKVVAAGASELIGSLDWVVSLARYNPDGSLDMSFGTNGTVMTDLGRRQDIGNAVALQSDGSIVVAGRTGSAYDSSDNDFAIVRYEADGSQDHTFGTNGVILTDFAGARDEALAVLVQPDGKIVAAGTAWNGTDVDIALARYTAATALEVRIDIRPGNPLNVINMRSPGTIPVAILSAPDFDAPASVERSSLTFGTTGNEHSLAFCNKKAVDLNRDRLPDLLCHFKTKLTGFRGGDTLGILQGFTSDGTPIMGQDAVKVLK